MRKTPLRKRNPKRAAERFERDFGGKPYLEFIHGLECAICGALCEWTEAAHVKSRGAGGRAADLVPLCGTRWGILGCHAKFDAHDPEARSHEPRLRSLARRLWSEWQTRTETEEGE